MDGEARAVWGLSDVELIARVDECQAAESPAVAAKISTRELLTRVMGQPAATGAADAAHLRPADAAGQIQGARRRRETW